jgi:hypothetical protein
VHSYMLATKSMSLLLLIFVPTSRELMFDPPAGFLRPPGFSYLLMVAPGVHQAPFGAMLATTIQPYLHGSACSSLEIGSPIKSPSIHCVWEFPPSPLGGFQGVIETVHLQ